MSFWRCGSQLASHGATTAPWAESVSPSPASTVYMSWSLPGVFGGTTKLSRITLALQADTVLSEDSFWERELALGLEHLMRTGQIPMTATAALALAEGQKWSEKGSPLPPSPGRRGLWSLAGAEEPSREQKGPRAPSSGVCCHPSAAKAGLVRSTGLAHGCRQKGSEQAVVNRGSCQTAPF